MPGEIAFNIFISLLRGVGFSGSGGCVRRVFTKPLICSSAPIERRIALNLLPFIFKSDFPGLMPG